MLMLLFAAVVLFLLALLYRYMPSRKQFYILLALLFAAVFAAFGIHTWQKNNVTLTESEISALYHQQEIFSLWYADYQKKIDTLDRLWRRYHQIVSDLENDNIDALNAYLRMNELANDYAIYLGELAKFAPPIELNDYAYDLITQMLKETEEYAAAQNQTVTQSAIALNPDNAAADTDLLINLKGIMVRESPPKLFIADEVNKLRDNLAIKVTIEKGTEED